MDPKIRCKSIYQAQVFSQIHLRLALKWKMVPSHLGKPIAENLDPRHGDSDIAPVLRQSLTFFLCSRHSSTLKVNIGRALCFFLYIFVKKQIPILHAGSLSHKSNTSSFHFFHQKNKFLYYTLDPRASKSLLFLEILIKKQYLFDPRPSPIRPEPQNRYFS